MAGEIRIVAGADGIGVWERTGTTIIPTTTGDVVDYSNASVKGLGWFDVRAYGANGSGTTDDSDAVIAAIAAAAVSGGTVFFPPGTYRIDSQIVIPNDGATVPTQKTMRIIGSGAHFAGQAVAISGGTVLDLRYVSGSDAKFKTRGLGHLEIEGITFTSTVTSSNPFILATNTTIHPHNCAFVGNATKSLTTCDQDAIVLGGTTLNNDGTDDSPFQGYGTVIERNYFDRIRRGVYGRRWVNGIVVRDNTWWNTCGTDVGAGGAIEFIGEAVAYCTGNSCVGNLIEAGGYAYPVKLEYAEMCYFANAFFDEGGGVTAEYYFGPHALYNLVIDVARTDTVPLIAEITTAIGKNTVLTAHQTQASVFAQPVTLGNVTTAKDELWCGLTLDVQPTVPPPVDGSLVFRIRRSAAESVNPGTYACWIANSGEMLLGGNNAGNITFSGQDGTPFSAFAGRGRQWNAAGSGGDMQIHTGTGGSYLTLFAYALKLKDHNGANEVKIKSGTGSPEGSLTATVGSVFLRTDGGENTTLYVKEVGAGNTGWTATVARVVGSYGQKTESLQASAVSPALSSGSTYTFTNLIPAGSLVVGVTIRVNTLITGATSISIGDGTDADRWGAGIAVAAGTTTTLANATITTPPIYAAATSVVLTAAGSDFTAGVVRATVHYISLTAATS